MQLRKGKSISDLERKPNTREKKLKRLLDGNPPVKCPYCDQKEFHYIHGTIVCKLCCKIIG